MRISAPEPLVMPAAWPVSKTVLTVPPHGATTGSLSASPGSMATVGPGISAAKVGSAM